MEKPIYVEAGQLVDASFSPHTTVTYRLKERAAVGTRTVIIPNGFTPEEMKRIGGAIGREFDEPEQDAEPDETIMRDTARALYEHMSDSDTPWKELPAWDRKFWIESVRLVWRMMR
ncbi:hypothetical protein [Bifidobacterium sp. SO1]|uniref:hypothetical protein n=1 Tax=Bifidobacterium sp. SO1 TaxID=2809029 RepID=UPI001BDD48D3|nr:hypothetical protein [Bifidobacterium sp. SO1]MBT1161680.1 hypothetical protein [Bifidobacterium sp. SO1]